MQPYGARTPGSHRLFDTAQQFVSDAAPAHLRQHFDRLDIGEQPIDIPVEVRYRESRDLAVVLGDPRNHVVGSIHETPDVSAGKSQWRLKTDLLDGVEFIEV